MAAIVYVLCAITSFACALLLLRAYRQRQVRLLFWSGLSFVGFTFGNLFLVIDRMTVSETDLSLFRSLPVLAGLLVLIYGLVLETE